MPGRRARVLLLLVAGICALGTAWGGVPERLEDCDAAVRSAPRDYNSYDCYRTLARTRQQWDGAVERLEAILARDDRNTLARVVLARVESDRGGARAEGLFRRVADEFAAAAMPIGEVYARLDLAFLLRRQGRLDEAEAEVGRARGAAEASKAPILLANVSAEEGWIAQSRSDFGRAYALFRQAERDVFPQAPWFLQSSVLSGIGNALWSMGRLQDARVYFTRLAEAHRARGDAYDVASELYNVALISGRLVEEGSVSPDELRRLLQEALAAAIRGRNRRVESAVRQTIAEDPGLGVETRMAETRRALELAEEVGDEGKALFALRELARLSLMENPDRPETALRLTEEAVARARATGNLGDIALGLIRRAMNRWVTGPREQAIEEAREALDAIERIRDLQRDDMIRARVGSEWAHFYYVHSGAILAAAGNAPREEDLELAFSTMERLRGRVLLDVLDAARATRSIGIGGPAHEKRDEILEEMGRLRQRLLDPQLSPEDRRHSFARLDELEAGEAAASEELVRADPAYATLRHPDLPTIAEVRAALEPEEAVLAFQIADRLTGPRDSMNGSGSWVLVIAKEGARAHPLPDEKELNERVSAYLGLIGRRDGSEVEGSKRLHHDLMEAALRDVPSGTRRLIVVPDRVLFRLPFDALRAPDGTSIAARYEISVAPSAALWLRWRRAGARGGPVPALVFADPELDAPASGPPGEGLRLSGTGSSLGPLPHARSEARAILRALGGDSQARIGSEASESSVKQAGLRPFRVVHFAVHALIDDEHPERSALVLAPGNGSEDGLLHIREIVGLDLPGSVVVLSACRTSAGMLLRGEGAMSLARAFFQAGARVVVGSLWPVRDDEARTMVSAFYGGIARGRSAGEALKEARASLMRGGAPAAAWAGWVLMGDGSEIPLPGGGPARSLPLWPLVLLPVLALAVLLVLRLLRRSA